MTSNTTMLCSRPVDCNCSSIVVCCFVVYDGFEHNIVNALTHVVLYCIIVMSSPTLLCVGLCSVGLCLIVVGDDFVLIVLTVLLLFTMMSFTNDNCCLEFFV